MELTTQHLRQGQPKNTRENREEDNEKPQKTPSDGYVEPRRSGLDIRSFPALAKFTRISKQATQTSHGPPAETPKSPPDDPEAIAHPASGAPLRASL